MKYVCLLFCICSGCTFCCIFVIHVGIIVRCVVLCAYCMCTRLKPCCLYIVMHTYCIRFASSPGLVLLHHHAIIRYGKLWSHKCRRPVLFFVLSIHYNNCHVLYITLHRRIVDQRYNTCISVFLQVLFIWHLYDWSCDWSLDNPLMRGFILTPFELSAFHRTLSLVLRLFWNGVISPNP